MVLIPQNPHGILNPVFRVGWQLGESIRLNGDRSSFQTRCQPRELLARVGFELPETVERMFPHQLSGGMAQRVLTAAGLAAAPRVVSADEPTKGLDSAARNRCLELLRTCFLESALLLITHDLKAAVCFDRAAVMYGGKLWRCARGHSSSWKHVIPMPRVSSALIRPSG
jgi:ABC-type dipeptide/oligopeptide/nickel transport system ATPase component